MTVEKKPCVYVKELHTALEWKSYAAVLKLVILPLSGQLQVVSEWYNDSSASCKILYILGLKLAFYTLHHYW